MLKSMKNLTGYLTKAVDGDIRTVNQFVFICGTWIVRYIAVDTGNWPLSGKVLVSPQWIENVRWADSDVQVDLSRQDVKDSPKYGPSSPVNREYEVRMYDYYGRVVYWESRV